MFDTFVVQPIFNFLVLIAAIIPGHNFGLAIIVFTIFVRLALWPLVKRQLHHSKALRSLQPELKKIKQASGGDKRKERLLVMELYKEREINPFAPLGVALVQLPILLGLFFAVRRIVEHPGELYNFSYSFLQNLNWLKGIAADVHQFDETLLGLVDLTRAAVSNQGLYFPALLIVAASAVVQFFQSKQLMPSGKDARSLRTILKEAGQGKQADQGEVTAAVGRNTLFLIPFLVFIFGLNFPAALPLYWLTSSGVALIQQTRVLRKDVEEAETIVTQKSKKQKAKISKQKTVTNKQEPVDKKQKPEEAAPVRQTSSGVKVYRISAKDRKKQ